MFGCYRLLLLLAVAGTSFSARSQSSCQMRSLTPQGLVRQVRQIQATFTSPMVALGDPQTGSEVFSVACDGEKKGEGHWIDVQTWVYDFKQDLPAGVTCVIKVNQNAACLSGEKVSGPKTFRFSTGGPEVLSTDPSSYYTVHEDSAFILKLNGPVTADSVKNHVYFKVPGIGSRVGVRIITGQVRDQLLDYHYQWREKPTVQELERVVIIQADRAFPEGAKVQLVWGQGVQTPNGVSRQEPQVLEFKVRKAFRVTFSCERENAGSPCIPVGDMKLRFTSQISAETAGQISLVDPDGEQRHPELSDHTTGMNTVTFKGPFPDDTALTVILPADVRDESGRKLVNQDKFPLQVNTGRYPPLLKFPGSFGILEAHADPTLPITVRNVEATLSQEVLAPLRKKGDTNKGFFKRLYDKLKARLTRVPLEDVPSIMAWLHRVEAVDRSVSIFETHDKLEDFDRKALDQVKHKALQERKIPRPGAQKDFEVIGMPFDGPGFYVIEASSDDLGKALLGKPKPMYVNTAVLVTNLAVHFKRGDQSSLVWVTSLDDGDPVSGAWVTIWDCKGKRYFEGKTGGDGWVRIDANLPSSDKAPQCEAQGYSRYSSGLLVVAQKHSDVSFVHTSWNDGIEPWRFNLSRSWRDTHMAAHTIFARTLLKPGETVHMKHVLRQRLMEGFQIPEDRPAQLLIEHDGTNQSWTLPLTWSEDSTAATQWTLPQGAKLGSYRTYLLKGNRDDWSNRILTGNFTVGEFRIPLTKGIIQPPKETLVRPTSMDYDVAVTYLNGGGASELPVRFRVDAKKRISFAFPGFEGFTFANGSVQAGVTRSANYQDHQSTKVLFDERLTLDRRGTGNITVKDLPDFDEPVELASELEYTDPNGEIQTISQRTPVWPSRLVVGIKPDSWALSKDDVELLVASVGVDGSPRSGISVTVDVFERKRYSHRKRIIGGFYAYEHVSEVKRLGELCQGQTKAGGIFTCRGKAPATGELILQARVVDQEGRASVAHRTVWIAGEDDWWFDVSDSDRMDLLPEKDVYEPGETARFQVRMPFREATALITVEREGVGTVVVRTLSGKEPVVEVPIEGHYAPNVYVSVLAVRGRVDGPKPTALADLAKPAFKLGIASIKVGWRAHELQVAVEPRSKTYKVRDEAEVSIQVVPAANGALPEGASAALAVVDEGLLELKANTSWNLLEAMMGERLYQIDTVTAAMQVVGKRHFGLKARPDGGGGGTGGATRTIFDSLVYWNPSIPLGRGGKAIVKFPLNDSLTSFRIVAIAHAGVDLFGHGESTIKTTQDVMVLPAFPPLARQGDVFQGTVTLRNTTKGRQDVTVTLETDDKRLQFESQKVTLPAEQSGRANWEIRVPSDRDSLRYTITATDSSGVLDKVDIAQKVQPVVPVRTLQATIFQLDGKESVLPVGAPTSMLPERGGLAITPKSSLLASLTGVRSYMEDYSYTCLEQRASAAIALDDLERWSKAMAGLTSHLDDAGFVKYFPTSNHGSAVLSAYLLKLAHITGWPLPEQPRIKILNALVEFVEGRASEHAGRLRADLVIRKLIAMEALSRFGRATAAMVSSLDHVPNQWPTSSVIDWYNILHRVNAIPETKAKLEQATQILKSRITFRGTRLDFSSPTTDHLWWLMVTPQTNGVNLILSLLEFQEWREETPRLVRGVLPMLERGHFDLTTTNALGALAFKGFAEAFENHKVTGVSRFTVQGGPEVESVSKTYNFKNESAPQAPHVPTTGPLFLPFPKGQAGTLTSTHQGQGQPWVLVESRAAVPLQGPNSRGLTIRRKVSPLEQKEKGKWHVGDVVRIRLELESQSDLTWVVASDPVPSGATILGSGLGGDSRRLTQGERSQGWVWPAFKEQGQEAFRAYYEYVPKGTWAVEYTLRFNNAGRFHLPPSRVEAMYSPDIHGEQPNDVIQVLP